MGWPFKRKSDMAVAGAVNKPMESSPIDSGQNPSTGIQPTVVKSVQAAGKKLSGCAQGDRFYFRKMPNGQTQRVVCPMYKWEERQRRLTEQRNTQLERIKLQEASKREKVKTSLYKMTPSLAGATAGVYATGKLRGALGAGGKLSTWAYKHTTKPFAKTLKYKVARILLKSAKRAI